MVTSVLRESLERLRGLRRISRARRKGRLRHSPLWKLLLSLLFFCSPLFVIEVIDVGKIPLRRVWKIDTNFLRWKKKCQESQPPPPPPPAHQLFQDSRNFRGWWRTDLKKNCCVRTWCKIRTPPPPLFPKASYGPVSQFVDLMAKNNCSLVF